MRARYLNTGIGRFITRDTWPGNYQRPLSLNGWNYVEGNPVNFTDPPGLTHSLTGQFFDTECQECIPDDPPDSKCLRIPIFWGGVRICLQDYVNGLVFGNQNSCTVLTASNNCKEVKDAIEEAKDAQFDVYDNQRFTDKNLLAAALEKAIRREAARRGKAWEHLENYGIRGRDHVEAYLQARRKYTNLLKKWDKLYGKYAEECRADLDNLRDISNRISQKMDLIERDLKYLEDMSLEELIDKQQRIYDKFFKPPFGSGN